MKLEDQRLPPFPTLGKVKSEMPDKLKFRVVHKQQFKFAGQFKTGVAGSESPPSTNPGSPRTRSPRTGSPRTWVAIQ